MPLWLDLDWKLLFWVNHRFSGNGLDSIMILLSNKDLWWLLCAAFFLFSLAIRSRRCLKLAVVIVLAVGASDLLAYRAFKPFFHRPRPCHQTDKLRVPTGCGSPFGFPSNHATNGMAVTAVLTFAETGPWALASLGLALLVGLSRVYLGVHFPTDVLAGFAVGGIIGSLIGVFFFGGYLINSRRRSVPSRPLKFKKWPFRNLFAKNPPPPT